MTLNFEAEVNVPFDFDVEALAGEVINFTLEHEDFPYEPEVNLTLVDNEGSMPLTKNFVRLTVLRMFYHFQCFPMKMQEIFQNWKMIMMIILTRIPEKLCLEIL